MKLPLWVAESEAVMSDGALNIDLIGSQIQESLADLLETRRREAARKPAEAKTATSSAEPDVCFGERPTETPIADATLTDLALSSSAIFYGKIEEVAVGFFTGIPGSLLRVKLEKALRNQSNFAVSDSRVYVYYPSGVIRADGETICTRPALHKARPQAGDRVLIFAGQGPPDREKRVVYTQASRHLIFQTAAGQLLLPPHLERSLAGFADIADVERRVEWILGLTVERARLAFHPNGVNLMTEGLLQ